MRLGVQYVFMLVLAGILHVSVSAQQSSPYIVNGNAQVISCNCYIITPDQPWMAGSVWNKNKIDLNNSFNYVFNVYLGSKDDDGADGVVFVLQQIGTSVGTAGQGLGFQNISPSIGIPIDTYQNFDYNDPTYDHIGIYKNGDLVNGSPNTLAGPVQAVQYKNNIEDGQWHTLRIIWDASAKLLSAEIDGVPRVQANVDLVKDIFFNQPEVYWGFSGATGGLNNLQKICTSLNPHFATQKVNSCAPAQLTFTDSSTSFGTVTNWWWDFGDGTTFTGEHPGTHLYKDAGEYTIRMNIEANNGCSSDTLHQQITIGSKPIVSISSDPRVICANNESLLTANSFVQFGTFDHWSWNFNNGAELIQTPDSTLKKTFPVGPLNIQVVLETVEGCISEPFSKSMDITLKPAVAIQTQDACYGDPVRLTSVSLPPDVPIRQWYWNAGDGTIDSSASVNHFYPEGGIYPVQMYAVNDAGCVSDTAIATVTIYQSIANAGNDTVVAFNQPLQLHAKGGELYEWFPATGLSDPEIANPIAILSDNMEYVLKAYTSFGCPTYDTLFVKAYKGPDIYVPNAFTPDNNGRNDYFHPVIVGMSSIEYFEVFNRLGQKVFSSQGAGRGWDGRLNGMPQPMGTYIWIIKGQDYLGGWHSEKGTVVLIR